jgi:hypothetical protein
MRWILGTITSQQQQTVYKGCSFSLEAVIFSISDCRLFTRQKPYFSLLSFAKEKSLNESVDVSKIQRGGHYIEVDLNAIICNLVALTIPKWRTFELLRWMQNLHQSMWDGKILCANKSSKDEQVLIPFLKTQKCGHRGWLKVKIHILFYGHNSWTVALN